jgi:hypothetical protein
LLEELQHRNYAESTIHAYIRTVEHFSRYFHRLHEVMHLRPYRGEAPQRVVDAIALTVRNGFDDFNKAHGVRDDSGDR